MEKAKQVVRKHWSKAFVGCHLAYFGNAFIEGNYAAAAVASMIVAGVVFHLNVGE